MDRLISRLKLALRAVQLSQHKLNREQEKLLKEFAKARGEKEGDVTIKRHEEGLFAKFRDAFHR
jgi:molecular chaperone DnaJ